MGQKNWAAFVAVLFVVFCWTPYASCDHKRDDFISKKDIWWWRSDGRADFPEVMNGHLRLKVEDPTSSEYSNTEIMDNNEHLYQTVRMRLATTQMQEGSRGWGLWDGSWPIDFNSVDLIWPYEQYDASQASNSFWRFWVTSGNFVTNTDWSDSHDLSGQVDPSVWHTYEITWKTDLVELRVDEELIAQTTDPELMAAQSLQNHIWIDNRVTDLITQNYMNRGWTGTSEIYLDYVEFIDSDTKLSVSHTPEGAMLLWERVNMFAPGGEGDLFRKFSFEAPSCEGVVTVTARAERYVGLTGAGADDMQIAIDSIDYGWDSAKSFNGDIDDGRTKALVFKENFSAGSHTIQLNSNASPLLYDVVVLGAPDYDLVLNDLTPITDGGGTEYPLKSYDFRCAEGLAYVVISATAEEDYDGTMAYDREGSRSYVTEGEAHPKGELRIVLDGKDYGFGGEYGFDGNELRGDAKTVVLNVMVSAGDHTLELWANGEPTLLQALVYAPRPLAPSPQPVDIRLLSHCNVIIPWKWGLIPVAILSTDELYAPTEVLKDSLTFGRTGDEQSKAFCLRRGRDVNHDRLGDLICFFRSSLTGFQVGDTEGILKGTTVGGDAIEGRSSVKIKTKKEWSFRHKPNR